MGSPALHGKMTIGPLDAYCLYFMAEDPHFGPPLERFRLYEGFGSDVHEYIVKLPIGALISTDRDVRWRIEYFSGTRACNIYLREAQGNAPYIAPAELLSCPNRNREDASAW